MPGSDTQDVLRTKTIRFGHSLCYLPPLQLSSSENFRSRETHPSQPIQPLPTLNKLIFPFISIQKWWPKRTTYENITGKRITISSRWLLMCMVCYSHSARRPVHSEKPILDISYVMYSPIFVTYWIVLSDDRWHLCSLTTGTATCPGAILESLASSTFLQSNRAGFIEHFKLRNPFKALSTLNKLISPFISIQKWWPIRTTYENVSGKKITISSRCYWWVRFAILNLQED